MSNIHTLRLDKDALTEMIIDDSQNQGSAMVIKAQHPVYGALIIFDSCAEDQLIAVKV